MAEREPIERRESPGHPTGAEMGNKEAIDEGSPSPAPAEGEWGGMTTSPAPMLLLFGRQGKLALE